MHQHVNELREMLDRVEDHVEYLHKERQATQKQDREDIERYCRRITVLEEEVVYQRVMIDVLSEEVEQLREEIVGLEELGELMNRNRYSKDNHSN
jgi:uncharacterized coiled-coil protein SlyX